MKHVLTLAHGRGKDMLTVDTIGSRGDKLITFAKEGTPLVEVRLTGDEWRALKEWRLCILFRAGTCQCR